MTEQMVTCPDCQGLSKVDMSAGHGSFRCPHCNSVMTLSRESSATESAKDHRLQCPRCSGQFQIPRELTGDLVKCPHCLDTVRIPLRDAASPPAQCDDDAAPAADITTTPPLIVEQPRGLKPRVEKSFVISLGNDEEVTLHDTAKTVEWRGARIELRELSTKARNSRRGTRNLAVAISCVLLLVITAVLLLKYS